MPRPLDDEDEDAQARDNEDICELFERMSQVEDRIAELAQWQEEHDAAKETRPRGVSTRLIGASTGN